MPCVNKCRTTGVAIIASNRGIVLGFRELFGSESLTQVVHFCLDVYGLVKNPPNFLVYDNGNKLETFLQNKLKAESNTERANILLQKTFIVDRFHILNHKDSEGRQKCDANNFDELNNVNTETCEKINNWLSWYKQSIKYLNYPRFIFYLFNILNDRNEAIFTKKCKDIININK